MHAPETGPADGVRRPRIAGFWEGDPGPGTGNGYKGKEGNGKGRKENEGERDGNLRKEGERDSSHTGTSLFALPAMKQIAVCCMCSKISISYFYIFTQMELI